MRCILYHDSERVRMHVPLSRTYDDTQTRYIFGDEENATIIWMSEKLLRIVPDGDRNAYLYSWECVKFKKRDKNPNPQTGG